MFVVFDLDGTLALNEHRVHLIRGPVKDWDAFYAACVDDPPNEIACQIIWRHISVGDNVEIWTGRSEAVRAQTERWLERFVCYRRPMFRSLLIYMRPVGDHRTDVELKAQWLRDEQSLRHRKPDLVYEDRASVVAMWRAAGIPCFQVAPGEF